ncbi:myosin light chain 6B [Hydra vulgaris]|uniref:Myosin light chain 6B n=1 Tax=Hydra vulgaris TaxID=6087 RepID=A0ABM4BH97_HYDVU
MASINDDEIDDIREKFDLFDKIGDGKISDVQIIDVLRACGLNPLTNDVEKIKKDSSLVGKRIDLETFCPIYEQIASMSGQATYEDMVEAFKTFDRDQTGTISAGELRQLLVNLGDTLTEEQADVIVQPHEDEKGAVSYHQIIKHLMAS